MLGAESLRKLKRVQSACGDDVQQYVEERISTLHKELEHASSDKIPHLQGQIQELRTLLNNMQTAKTFNT